MKTLEPAVPAISQILPLSPELLLLTNGGAWGVSYMGRIHTRASTALTCGPGRMCQALTDPPDFVDIPNESSQGRLTLFLDRTPWLPYELL